MPRRPLRAPFRSAPLAALVALAALAALACSRREPPGAAQGPEGAGGAAGAGEGDEGDDDAGAPAARAGGPAEVPSGPDYDVTPGAGPKIAAKATQTWVYEGPNDETLKLGYLRAGAVVDRGRLPVATTKRCKKGWYRVAPEGFVCDGRRATLDLADPVVVASWRPPKRGAPLPYLYGRSRDVPPMLYVRVPTRKEQERAESSPLDDLPPRERLLPLTGEPEPLPPFLAAGKPLPKPFGGTQRLQIGAHEGRAPPRSAFAFLSVHDVDGRLFGLSTNMNLVALDRLQLAKPVAIHGGEVTDLPAGIVQGVTPRYKLGDGGAAPARDGQYARFDVVSLTGRQRDGLWETTDGYGVSSGSFKLVKKRDEWPSFAKPPAHKKWVDVSVSQQQIIAYEGQRAVYVAPVSTGAGGLADPELTTATKRGVFTIKSKHLTATMTGAQAEEEYELADVPYVQYFEAGYALHAAYWHDEFGRPRSHGCINLTPPDAAWLFEWTEPALPQGWHGVQAAGAGTIVYVRP
jgi:lipoprotein-anchoring transpeptidase ErfK/SrfK